MYRILIVDDDQSLLLATTALLENAGYEVTAYHDSKIALISALNEEYDLMLIDYQMPGINGESFVDICKSVNNDTNILMFSGDYEIEGAISMLDKDIVDFISKDTDPRMFLKKVELAISKKVSTNKYLNNTLESKQENLVLEFSSRRVIKDDKSYNLSQLEFQILTIFLSQKNTILTRDEIHELAWESRGQTLEDLRTIDVYILKLRKKLDLNCIVSIRGVGYEWTEK